MPLDVQPLSRKRQWVTLIVMVGLLAASLGGAQLLVARAGGVIRVRSFFGNLPDGVIIPVNQSFTDILNGTTSAVEFKVGGKLRRCMAFSFEDTENESAVTYLSLLWYQVISKLDPDKFPLEATSTILGGRAALQTGAYLGNQKLPAFAMLRLARIENHVVAFSYSGDGPLTDGDKGFFDQYCTTRIQVEVILPEGQKAHPPHPGTN